MLSLAPLVLVVAASWAESNQARNPVAEAQRELEQAYVVAGTAARAFEATRTGTGVNRVNPDRHPPVNSPGGIDYFSLEQQAHRRQDAAKAVAADLEHRLAVLHGLVENGKPDWVAWDRALGPNTISPPSGNPGGDVREPMTLAWGAVAGAEAYAVEIQCLGCCVRGEWCVSRYVPDHPSNDLTNPYTGPSRWRVRARIRQGYVGPASSWSYIGVAD